MGFPRLPLEEKVQLIPTVLMSLDGKPSSHQDSILTLILPWLEHVKAPTDNPGSYFTSSCVGLKFCRATYLFLKTAHFSHNFHKTLNNGQSDVDFQK